MDEKLAAALIEALDELVLSIERRWAGESERKRENAVSPRTEDAIVVAKALLARAANQDKSRG